MFKRKEKTLNEINSTLMSINDNLKNSKEERWVLGKIVDECGDIEPSRVLGLLRASKLWKNSYQKIYKVIDWCKEISESENEFSKEYLTQTINNIYEILKDIDED